MESGWMPVGWSVLSWREMLLASVKTLGEYIEDKFIGSFENRRMTIPKPYVSSNYGLSHDDLSLCRFFESMKMNVRHALLRKFPNGPHFKTSTADVVQAWLWKVILFMFNNYGIPPIANDATRTCCQIDLILPR